jgi:hypothetical protein
MRNIKVNGLLGMLLCFMSTMGHADADNNIHEVKYFDTQDEAIQLDRLRFQATLHIPEGISEYVKLPLVIVSGARGAYYTKFHDNLPEAAQLLVDQKLAIVLSVDRPGLIHPDENYKNDRPGALSFSPKEDVVVQVFDHKNRPTYHDETYVKYTRFDYYDDYVRCLQLAKAWAFKHVFVDQNNIVLFGEAEGAEALIRLVYELDAQEKSTINLFVIDLGETLKPARSVIEKGFIEQSPGEIEARLERLQIPTYVFSKYLKASQVKTNSQHYVIYLDSDLFGAGASDLKFNLLKAVLDTPEE